MIEEERQGRIATVRLDTLGVTLVSARPRTRACTVADDREALLAAVQDAALARLGPTKVVLDLTDYGQWDSLAIGVVAALHRLAVAGGSPISFVLPLYRIRLFQAAGLDQVVDLHTVVSSALAPS